jgi:hypothetical protein
MDVPGSPAYGAACGGSVTCDRRLPSRQNGFSVHGLDLLTIVSVIEIKQCIVFVLP